MDGHTRHASVLQSGLHGSYFKKNKPPKLVQCLSWKSSLPNHFTADVLCNVRGRQPVAAVFPASFADARRMKQRCRRFIVRSVATLQRPSSTSVGSCIALHTVIPLFYSPGIMVGARGYLWRSPMMPAAVYGGTRCSPMTLLLRCPWVGAGGGGDRGNPALPAGLNP